MTDKMINKIIFAYPTKQNMACVGSSRGHLYDVNCVASVTLFRAQLEVLEKAGDLPSHCKLATYHSPTVS